MTQQLEKPMLATDDDIKAALASSMNTVTEEIFATVLLPAALDIKKEGNLAIWLNATGRITLRLRVVDASGVPLFVVPALKPAVSTVNPVGLVDVLEEIAVRGAIHPSIAMKMANKILPNTMESDKFSDEDLVTWKRILVRYGHLEPTVLEKEEVSPSVKEEDDEEDFAPRR